MKLEEAIRVTEQIIATLPGTLNDKEREALQLGIEAMKWRLLMELDYGSWCGPLLPGETKD